jgi:4-amino-4-deoxy-L-arabinose transferase-like glycosyltransferase
VRISVIKVLRAIFILALLLRVAWSLHLQRDPAGLSNLPDQVEYFSLGQNVLHHRTLFFYDPRFYQAIYAYRMPGYPIFISLCGGSVFVVRIAQAIIDSASIFAVFLVARRFWSVRAALIAAAFVAINPFLIYFSGLILSETLCTAMILWGAALCLSLRANKDSIFTSPGTPEKGKTMQNPRRRGWENILGPILLALSVLVRPSGLFLPVILPLFSGLRRGFALVGLLLLIMLLSLWAWRNDAILGKWIWITTNGGITQYDGFNPQATGASDQRFVAQMPYLQQLDEVERNNYLAGLTRHYIREHPGRIVPLALAKLARTFSPIPLSEQFSRPIYLAIAAAYSVPIFLLAIVQLIRGRGGWRVKMFLLCVPIYFAVVHAFSVGSLRYRLPAEPFIAILAAGAVGEKMNAE